MSTDIEDHRQRPTAVWFRAARASQLMDDGAGGKQSWTVDELIRRMEAEVGWAPSRPNYSTYENGHTVPKPATMAIFYRFWSKYGIEPPDLSPAPAPESTPGAGNLIEALAAQTAAITALIEELQLTRVSQATIAEETMRALAAVAGGRELPGMPDGDEPATRAGTGR